MSRTYTPEEKAAALQRLDANRGQVLRTSLQTGIPDRTLQRWKALRDIQPPQPPPNFSYSRRQPPPPGVGTAFLPSEQQPAPSPLVEETRRALEDDYDSLRQHLVREALTIAASLSYGVHEAPLNQRAIALSRLVDRIVKLDSLTSYDESFVVPYEEQDDELDGTEEDTLSFYWGLPPNDTYGPYPKGMLPGHIEEQLKRDGFANVRLRLAREED